MATIRRLTIYMLLMLAGGTAWAYGFSAVVPSGQTLYFNYVEGGVEVTHPSDQSGYINAWSGYTKPTGELTVPAYITHNDTSYAVVAVGAVAMYYCTGLTKLTVSEGIVRVDDYAFNYCSGIEEIHLPSTLESVGNQSFGNLESLTDVWVAANEPPTAHIYSFYNTVLDGCTLHVDCSAVDAYGEADIWSGFGTVADAGCKATLAVLPSNAAHGSVTGSGTYDVGTVVTITATAAEGYRFICWSDGDTAAMRLVTLTENCSYTAIFLPEGMVLPGEADTVYLAVHDTTYTHDTVYYAVPTNDTVYHTDTVVVSVNVYVHDTVHVADTVYYTIAVHDTVELHDTIVPTFYSIKVLSDSEQLGVGVGTALLPAGVEAEVCGLPLDGGRFVSWDDGVTANPRRVTVTGPLTLRAMFEQVNVTKVEETAWRMHAEGRRLYVEGAEGDRVGVYDVQGRCLLSQECRSAVMALQLPAAGVYLVQVGDGAARRIIVK